MRPGNPQALRLYGRLRRPSPVSALELALLALVAVQAARLFWAVLTPVGPVGDWKAPASLTAPAATSGLGDFDPFFRLSPGGSGVVTSLSLKLFGVREDRATGRGSAIIGLADGTQMSFGVGEEIQPGVRLVEVGFDSVTIDNGGAREQLFLDQSTAAREVGPPPPEPGPQGAPPQTVPPPPIIVPPQRPAPAAPPAPSGQGVQLQPRVADGRVDGVIVSPGADDRIFRAAGFAPGDVIVAIDGQPVRSVEQARAQVARAGGEVTVMVDRGGRAVPMRVRLR